MRVLFTLSMSLLSISALACTGARALRPAAAGDVSAQQPVAVMREVASGTQGPAVPVEALVRTREELVAVWPGPGPVPEVDFQREMVVVIALGSRPTGGYAVRLASLLMFQDSIVVRYEELRPGPTCMTTQALTYPYYVAAVPRGEGTARFERQVKSVVC